MALLLRKKKLKSLSFAAGVKLARVHGKPTTSSLKPRVKDTPDDRRQSERWTLAKSSDSQLCGLSVTAVEKWLDCKEQFRMERVQGYRAFKGSAAIDFGELWHWLLGRHYSAKHRRAANPMKDLEAGIALYNSQYLRDNPNLPDKRREEMDFGYLKTKALWPVYLEKYGEVDAEMKWVDVERNFEFGFSLPPISRSIRDAGRTVEVELCPGCVVPFRGIFDGVYRRKGRLWLFETKTKSQINEEELEDTMHLDLQVMTYLYAIYREFKEWPEGVTYNVIRNPASKVSEAKGETKDAFVERLEGTIRKEEDHYFKRWDMHVDQKDVEKFVDKQFEPILRDIQGWASGNHPHYVHTKALTGKYGKADMFDVIARKDFTGVERVEIKPEALRKER